jgi:uncharacterized protein (AIM24 family)
MQHRIRGTLTPVLDIHLAPGERLVSEAGELAWMDDNIELRTAATGMAGGHHGLGGVMKSLGRAVSGGSFWMTEYIAPQAPGLVVFATKLPGSILELPVNGEEYLVHRHGFLCGYGDVSMSIGLQRRLGAGIFGGAGFIMQRVGGQGTLFIELPGEVTEYNLNAGSSIRVHPGHVGLLESSVQLELVTVPGIKNKMFGNDGLFLAHLSGPGKVWLNSLSMPALAQSLIPYLPLNDAEQQQSGGVLGLANGLMNQ